MLPPNSPDDVTRTPINLIRKEVELLTLAPPKIHDARRRKRKNNSLVDGYSSDEEQDYECISSSRSMLGSLLIPNLNIYSELRQDMGMGGNISYSRGFSLPTPKMRNSTKDGVTLFFAPRAAPSKTNECRKTLNGPKSCLFSENDENRYRPRRKLLPIRISPRVSDVESSVINEIFDFKNM